MRKFNRLPRNGNKDLVFLCPFADFRRKGYIYYFIRQVKQFAKRKGFRRKEGSGCFS